MTHVQKHFETTCENTADYLLLYFDQQLDSFVMADTSIILSGIEYKIRKLIDENLSLKKTVADLHNEVLNLRLHEKELILQNKDLTEKIEQKIMADAFSSEKEIEEGRKRIQALMQEIEQCIALINK
ncbi:MAG: hypothetical protein KG029_04995 [Bacteroidetes bacterium]|nr:hypothetical protein [Bacteroidota bacterium]